MFGRKKKDLPAGARMMHYEGLRGFSQDGPCFMERTEAGLVFRQANGPAATLPLEKVTGLEMMPERNFMARYHGTAATTAYGKAVKWFAVFHYTTQEGERMLALWYTEPKTGSVLRELAVQIGAATQDYTLSCVIRSFSGQAGQWPLSVYQSQTWRRMPRKSPGPQRPPPCTRRWPRP